MPRPDTWEASARLVDTLAGALDGEPAFAAPGATWERAASGVVADLLDAEQSQVSLTVDGEAVLGLRAYARDATRYYEHDAEHTELMTVADVVAPLLLYLRLHPDRDAADLADRLRATLRAVPPAGGAVHLERAPHRWCRARHGHLVFLPQRADQDSVGRRDRRRPGARRGRDRWPPGRRRGWPMRQAIASRCSPTSDRRPVRDRSGAAPNASVAGLLAYGALLCDDLGGTGGAALATRLLKSLRQESAERCFHEPLQLGFAAAAASRLADAGDPSMASLAEVFVRAQLRMLYWDEDPEATAGGYAVRGMFEACASLLYPALKENVEAILPWTVLLRAGRGPTRLLLSVMNLVRVNSFAFFDPLLPRPRGDAAPWIPYENLGTSELPGTGSIGKEIYGAGEVLWAYLLFEAMARADDPAILVVNTDVLERASLRGSRRRAPGSWSTTRRPPAGHSASSNGAAHARPMDLAPKSWEAIEIPAIAGSP